MKIDEEIRKVPKYFICANYSLRVVVLRPTYTYGPGDFKNFGKLLIVMSGNVLALCHTAMVVEKPCPQMIPDWAPFSAVHIEDACNAAVASARWYCDKGQGKSEKTRVQVFNLSDPSNLSNFTILTKIFSDKRMVKRL